MAPTISSGLAALPMGMVGRISFISSGLPVMSEENFVSVRPGSRALTRILSDASSLAKDFVMPTTPALVIE